MSKPGTFNEIDGLITHLIDNNLTDDKELLSKIYVDMGVTGGAVFKLQFEKRTGKEVPDPYPSYFPSEPENKPEKGNSFQLFSIYLKNTKKKIYGFFRK
jgi:ribosomal protein S17E